MATSLDFNKGFAVGDIIGLEQNGSVRYVRVNARERLKLRVNHSAVSTGGTATSYSEITDLDPQEGEFYHVQKIVLERGNITATFRQPGAVSRFGTNRAPSAAELSLLDDEEDVEMFVLKNIAPHVSFANNGTVSTTPRLRYYGFKYRFSDVGKPMAGSPFTTVNVAGSTN